MKKFVALLLVVVMVGALGATALAGGIIDAVEYFKDKAEFKTFAIFNIIFEALKNIFNEENGIFNFVQEFVNRIKFKNILDSFKPEPIL